jgi:hypothetical protein
MNASQYKLLNSKYFYWSTALLVAAALLGWWLNHRPYTGSKGSQTQTTELSLQANLEKEPQPVEAPPDPNGRSPHEYTWPAIPPGHPRARSLDLPLPELRNNVSQLGVILGTILMLDLPKGISGSVAGGPMTLPPTEAKKLLEGLERLHNADFNIPGVVTSVTVSKERNYSTKESHTSFDSSGFTSAYISLEPGGAIFKAHHHRPGDRYVIRINPEKGEVYLTFFPGVLRDD